MPLPVIADTARCAIRGVTANGQPWVNVLHFQALSWDAEFIAGTAQPDVELIYDDTWMTTHHGWSFYSTSPGKTIDFTWTILDGTSASIIIAAEYVGQTGQDQLPGQNAIICSHQTGLRGASNRGRTFWAAPYEGLTDDDGSLVAATATNIADNWEFWRTDVLNPDGIVQVVASYKNAEANAVTNTIARSYFGHQDRRRN